MASLTLFASLRVAGRNDGTQRANKWPLRMIDLVVIY